MSTDRKMSENMICYLLKRKQQEGVSWKDFSDHVGLGKTTILNYMTGSSNPRLDSLEQLCIALGVTPNQVLLGDCPEQFVLEYVIPVISVVSQMPFKKQVQFVELMIQMLQLME